MLPLQPEIDLEVVETCEYMTVAFFREYRDGTL
jgi:hypothetical protein